jgi:outer membrane protein assembly factor BamB
MRAASWWMVLVLACSSGRLTSGSGSTGADPDAGAGAPDAGAAPDAGSPPSPGTISAISCPVSPPLLWTRTFSDEVDFRGAADGDGNVYWVEYDPPPTFANPNAPAWLVSADRNGRNLYRVPAPVASESGVFLIAGGKVVMSNGAALAAFDAATGAASWSIDLSATYSNSYAVVTGIADLGDGGLAFAMYDYGIASGLYRADAATGAILWSSVTTADAAYRVAGSDGAGALLAIGHPSSSYSPQQGYHSAADVFVLDASGRPTWSHRINDGPPGGGAVLAWSSTAPWLQVAGTQGLSPVGDYVAAPPSWFSAVEGSDFGFALHWEAAAETPIGVSVTRGGAVIAQGPIAGTTSYNGISAWPFLAGEAGDHLILLSQNRRSSPGLCHPSRAETAALSRFDATSSYQCPFTFQGESAIEGAALLDGRVILGRRTYLTDACTHEVQPVTIEAYGLPGDSLAASGWVQRGGSPGLGMRPRHR